MHRCTLAAHPKLPRPEGGWRLPEVGDTVDYRSDCEQPCLPALVVAVHGMDDEFDRNVWGADDRGVPHLLPDPNPNVEVELPDGARVVTRRVQYANSPGWSWPPGPDIDDEV